MVLAQDGGDLVCNIAHHFRTGRRGAERPELGIAGQSFHDAGVGHDDDVVLVLAKRVRALGSQPAGHCDRGVLDADGLPDRVNALPEEARRGGLADQAHLGGVAHIGFGEVLAGLKLPRAYFREVRAHAPNANRRVLVASHHLHRGAHLGADAGQTRHLTPERIVVAFSQVRLRTKSAPDTAPGHVAGKDDHQIVPHARNLALHLRFCARSHAHPHDDCGDSHDDPEHGEKRTHDVATDGTQRGFENCKHRLNKMNGPLLLVELRQGLRGAQPV